MLLHHLGDAVLLDLMLVLLPEDSLHVVLSLIFQKANIRPGIYCTLVLSPAETCFELSHSVVQQPRAGKDTPALLLDHDEPHISVSGPWKSLCLHHLRTLAIPDRVCLGATRLPDELVTDQSRTSVPVPSCNAALRRLVFQTLTRGYNCKTVSTES